MRKDHLHPVQKPMTDLTAVEDAAKWADWLVRREHRGPGDTIDAARLRAARKHNVPERALWSLRYRRPKDLLATVYLKLKSAYETECERQEAKLRHELEITKALLRSPAGDLVIAEVEAVLAEIDQQAPASASNRTD